MRAKTGILAAVAYMGVLWLAAPVCASAGKDKSSQLTDEQIRALPGYIDLDLGKAFGGREAKVEVNLKGPMLDLVGHFSQEEDPELPGVLANLKLVRVQVYDVAKEEVPKVATLTEATAKKLDAAGWERVVRVRDENQHVDVYFKPAADNGALDGIVVMVVGDDNEAVFVNLVGRIRPEDVQRLGAHFKINELDTLSADRARGRH